MENEKKEKNLLAKSFIFFSTSKVIRIKRESKWWIILWYYDYEYREKNMAKMEFLPGWLSIEATDWDGYKKSGYI